MTKFFGNLNQQQKILQLLRPDISCRTVALAGESHLGKFSFLDYSIRQILQENDIFYAENSVESARAAVLFSGTAPILSPYRAIIIDKADKLSDAACDAYLKLCEEPPNNVRVFLILTDEFHLPRTLVSRLDHIIRWKLLNEEEMHGFATPLSISGDIISLCFGKPGLLSVILENPEFQNFPKLIQDYSILSPVPEVLKELKSGVSIERESASWIIQNVARQNLQNKTFASNLFLFASNLIKYPSISAELHWKSLG